MFKAKNKKGIFITIIKILKLILVKKLSIIEIPVIPPSIIRFGIKKISSAKDAKRFLW